MFPVLVGIAVGYIEAALFGLVDFQSVIDAPWVGLPQLVFPTFEFSAIILIALIYTIPSCVMGGASLVLFGLIATNGMSMIMSEKIDLANARNQMIMSVILIVGIGMECVGIVIPVGDYSIPGMAACALVGVILNLILPGREPVPEDKVNDSRKAGKEGSAVSGNPLTARRAFLREGSRRLSAWGCRGWRRSARKPRPQGW